MDSNLNLLWTFYVQIKWLGKRLWVGCLILCATEAIQAQTSEDMVSSEVTASRIDIVRMLRISTGEYPPWVGAGLPGNGFVARVVRESFQLAGYDVEFTFFPWKRAYEQARQGSFDATAYWYPSELRRQDFLYSDSLHVESTHLFYHKSNPLTQWQRLEDLSGKKIGATDGYTYTDEFWLLARNGVLNVETAIRDELNMAKLVYQRIDLFPIEKHLGFSVLQQQFQPHVVHMIDYHPIPLMETTGHLLFSRSLLRSASLLDDFNRGLKQLKNSGRYDLLRELSLQRQVLE